MSKVTITLVDNEEEGSVEVSLDFGDEGAQEGSTAHLMGVKALRFLNDMSDEEDE